MTISPNVTFTDHNAKKMRPHPPNDTKNKICAPVTEVTQSSKYWVKVNPHENHTLLN